MDQHFAWNSATDYSFCNLISLGIGFVTFSIRGYADEWQPRSFRTKT